MSEEESDEAGSIPLSDLRGKLNDQEPEETKEPDQTADAGPDEGDTSTGGKDDAGNTDTSEEDQPDSDGSIPLAGLRSEVDRHEELEAETETAVGEDVFVEEDVDSVDSQEIWADLLMGEEDPVGQFEATDIEGDSQVISKRICERCRYVAEPPNLSCTHEGTTIHELVDVDHVRVSQCPMVGPDGETKSQRNQPSEDG